MHFPGHYMPLLTSDQSPKNHTKNAIHFFVDSVSIWKNRVFTRIIQMTIHIGTVPIHAGI